MNKEDIRKLRLNNRILRLKFSPINSITKNNIEHQLSFEKINISNLNKNKIKRKKILKPIKILSPKSNKQIDYLSVILRQRRNKSSKNKESPEKIKKYNSNNKIFDSLMKEKNKMDNTDKKIIKKKKIINQKD